MSVLLRGELSETQHRNLLRIQSSGERASRMSRDLLDFTQARLGGGIRIERRRVDVHEVVRGGSRRCRQCMRAGSCGCAARETWGGAWAPDRIAQVVQNLVTNALKYSPRDTPVDVETRTEGDLVVLSVHNQGTPILSELLERLFKPFQRANRDLDRTSRSVWLGLYVVRHLVEAHGGTVDVRSTVEEGTTFRARLPREPRASAPSDR